MVAVDPCRADVVGFIILGCRAAGWKAVDGFADAARRRKAETVFVFFIIMTDCCSSSLLLLKEEEFVTDNMICVAGNCVSYVDVPLAVGLV